jgi:hypothetical protein
MTATFNKTDAGYGSYGICRGIDGCQRPPVLPIGFPLASYVASLSWTMTQ